MPKVVTVKQGDCVASIAYAHGFFPTTIWDDAANRDLKNLRKNPNVLWPGDLVHIPDLRPGEEKRPVDKAHRFRRKGVPETLSLRFLSHGKPRADESCRVDIDGQWTETTTDAEGWITVPIPPGAEKARVLFDAGGDYRLSLGGMDPATETLGVQKRLANLKMFHGKLDGTPSPALEDAIRTFQASHDLDVTGEVDDATRTKLEEVAG